MPVINTPSNKSDWVPDWLYRMLSVPQAATAIKPDPSAVRNALVSEMEPSAERVKRLTELAERQIREGQAQHRSIAAQHPTWRVDQVEDEIERLAGERLRQGAKPLSDKVSKRIAQAEKWMNRK